MAFWSVCYWLKEKLHKTEGWSSFQSSKTARYWQANKHLYPHSFGCFLGDLQSPIQLDQNRPLPRLYRFIMTAVTERLRCCNFTTTEKYFFRFRRLIFNWWKFGPFVRAITKRLFLAEATWTPEIGFPRFNFNCKGCVCRSFRITHIIISLLNILKTPQTIAMTRVLSLLLLIVVCLIDLNHWACSSISGVGSPKLCMQKAYSLLAFVRKNFLPS